MVPEVPDAERHPVRLQGLAPCEEPGPLGRFLCRFRGRCPPGFFLFRAHFRFAGGRLFRAALPSRAFTTGAAAEAAGQPLAPQGISGGAPGHSSCEVCRPS